MTWASDHEFANVLAVSKDGARKIVAYLVDRGVGETEADLLGMAYFAGCFWNSNAYDRGHDDGYRTGFNDALGEDR